MTWPEEERRSADRSTGAAWPQWYRDYVRLPEIADSAFVAACRAAAAFCQDSHTRKVRSRPAVNDKGESRWVNNWDAVAWSARGYVARELKTDLRCGCEPDSWCAEALRDVEDAFRSGLYWEASWRLLDLANAVETIMSSGRDETFVAPASTWCVVLVPGGTEDPGTDVRYVPMS